MYKSGFKGLVLTIFTVLSIVVLDSSWAFANEDQEEAGNVRINKNVPVQMSDGINLISDLYFPEAEGKYPAVLVRTPYNKDYQSTAGKFFAGNGYVTVIQDVRGRYDSEGTFVMGGTEKQDGLETLDWITSQEWYEGGVAMWGPSYLSYCALLMAEENPPELKAVINESGITRMYDFTYLDGTLNQTMMALWLGAIVDRPTQRSFWGLVARPMFYVVPLKDLDEMMMDYQSGGWNTVVSHPTEDLYHTNLSVNDSYDRINVPILHLTGWNDWMYSMTLDAYRAMQDRDLPQRIIVGPWTHNQPLNGDSDFGDEDFGEIAQLGFDKELALCLEWFDYHVRGIDNGVMEKSRVRYFLMNDNVWVDDNVFPPATTERMTYYLTSSGQANSLNGDGRLIPTPPESSRFDKFTYDPLNPVPTKGGINCHLLSGLEGIYDQIEIEERPDVLVYTTDPLTANLKLVGDITAHLYVSTDVTDTDITAKLVELRADGYARIIEDGLAKTRFRNSFQVAEPITPGEIYELHLKLGTTAINVSAGSRLRLEVSSSNFPKYPRNPNTGETEAEAETFQQANQTVYHSSENPSRIELMFIP